MFPDDPGCAAAELRVGLAGQVRPCLDVGVRPRQHALPRRLRAVAEDQRARHPVPDGAHRPRRPLGARVAALLLSSPWLDSVRPGRRGRRRPGRFPRLRPRRRPLRAAPRRAAGAAGGAAARPPDHLHQRFARSRAADRRAARPRRSVRGRLRHRRLRAVVQAVAARLRGVLRSLRRRSRLRRDVRGPRQEPARRQGARHDDDAGRARADARDERETVDAEGRDAAHVDFVTDDLAGFLEQVNDQLVARQAPPLAAE